MSRGSRGLLAASLGALLGLVISGATLYHDDRGDAAASAEPHAHHTKCVLVHVVSAQTLSRSTVNCAMPPGVAHVVMECSDLDLVVTTLDPGLLDAADNKDTGCAEEPSDTTTSEGQHDSSTGMSGGTKGTDPSNTKQQPPTTAQQGSKQAGDPGASTGDATGAAPHVRVNLVAKSRSDGKVTAVEATITALDPDHSIKMVGAVLTDPSGVTPDDATCGAPSDSTGPVMCTYDYPIPDDETATSVTLTFSVTVTYPDGTSTPAESHSSNAVSLQ